MEADRSVGPWQHDHVFGQDRTRKGERRTIIVLVLTAVTMVAEIGAGLAFQSMALLADGFHMASHAMALAIAGLAYAYARRQARNSSFSFGTGKVNSLAGYTGAILLAGFVLLMALESLDRLFHPVSIGFDQAILVAFLGLLVNAASAVILGGHHLGESGSELREASSFADKHLSEDHNLRSAYLHVIADALTSVLAMIALLAGKYLSMAWMDPAMGIIGAVLITHWSVGLIRSTSRVLLDRQAPEPIRRAVRESIERCEGTRVSDLHVWCIGPGIFSAAVSVVTDSPKSVEQYRKLIPGDLGVVHVTIEVHEVNRPPEGA